MTVERLTMTERDIFIAALQIKDAVDRRAYLDEACAGQPELRQQAEQLLQLFENAGSFLENPAIESAATGVFPHAAGERASPEAPGTSIGPYKLIEQIGEGGMGTVWMAQQTQPVKRLVAVKLIKAGMDSKQVIARFEAERQALALMDHANIARVLDAGMTGAGRPYFVMDLVKGVPITKYCDEHHLTPRQRLELFIPVCQAIQHAHQKGIIHRDLKPSNLLIAFYDGKPVPKIIDFGVAKAAGQQLTDKTLVTGFGAIIGTLEYMSPEQAEVNQLDIDTRSDVYSLGVLLYELLAGSPPFSHQELQHAGMLEMLRVIREQEPAKPSTKLSTAEGLPTLAANRGTEPAKLTRLVRGELDWMVMKALEKDRNRRYQTANSFAADVQRYLADEPIHACPPSTAYRLRKFVRRNKGPVAASALLFVFLIGGITGTTIGLLRALRAKEDAAASFRRVRQTVDDMYTNVAVEWLADQPMLEPLQREFLQKAREFYEEFSEQTSEDPAIRVEAATASFRVAMIQYKLGEVTQAERAFNAAIEKMRKLVEEFPAAPSHRAALAETLRGFATLLSDTNRLSDAEKAFDRAISLYEQLVAEYPETAEYRYGLARSYVYAGAELGWTRPEESERGFRQAASILEQLAAEFPSVAEYRQYRARGLTEFGRVLIGRGRAEEARKLVRDAAALEQSLVEEQPQRAIYRHQLGDTYFWLAHSMPPNEAEPLLRKALGFQRNLLRDYPTVANYRYDVVRSLQHLARLTPAEESEELLREAVTIAENLERDTPEVGFYRDKLMTVYLELIDLLIRRNQFEDALAFSEKLAELKPDVPETHYALGFTLARFGRWNEAATAYDRGLGLNSSNHECWTRAAALHVASGDLDGYRRTCAQMVQRFGDTTDAMTAERTAKECFLMPDALSADDFDRAQELAERAVTGTEQHGYYGFFAMAKGLADYRADRDSEAIEWMVRWVPQVDGIHHDATRFAVLAMAQHSLGRYEEAAAALANAKAIVAKMPDPTQGQLFGHDWHSWLHAQVLCREAEELLKKSAKETGQSE